MLKEIEILEMIYFFWGDILLFYVVKYLMDWDLVKKVKFNSIIVFF